MPCRAFEQQWEGHFWKSGLLGVLLWGSRQFPTSPDPTRNLSAPGIPPSHGSRLRVCTPFVLQPMPLLCVL